MTQPARDKSTEASVAALSETVADLSREIAGAIRNLERRQRILGLSNINENPAKTYLLDRHIFHMVISRKNFRSVKRKHCRAKEKSYENCF